MAAGPVATGQDPALGRGGAQAPLPAALRPLARREDLAGLRRGAFPALWARLGGDAEVPAVLEALRAAKATSLGRAARTRAAHGDDGGAAEAAPALETGVAAVLLTTAPRDFVATLAAYYDRRLGEFSSGAATDRCRPAYDPEPDPDDLETSDADLHGAQARLGDLRITSNGAAAGGLQAMGAEWVRELEGVGGVLHDLGLGALSEEAYAQVRSDSRGVGLPVASPVSHAGPPPPVKVVCSQLYGWLAANVQGVYDKFCLRAARAYIAQVSLPFVQGLLAAQSGCSGALAQWQSRMEFFIYHALGSMRTEELFDIVVEYPDSSPAILDLKECLRQTGNLAKLVEQFRAAVEARLLHPAAATSDILTQYISMVRVLRLLDPSGMVLEAVVAPVKAYLKGRRDTIREVLLMLVDDSEDGDELLQHELAHGSPGSLEGDEAAAAESEWEALLEGERWEPDPVDATPAKPAGVRGRRTGDVVGLLLGIFADREKYTNEYKAMLAQKVLLRLDYGTDQDKKIFHLLKLRFPDKLLHDCDVMLKDVADSRRIDSNIKILKNAAGALERFDALIVSEQFWPQFQGEAAVPPPRIQRQMEAFAAGYRELRTPRSLHWRPQLGMVSLALHFPAGKGGLTAGPARPRTYTVPAAHACVIAKFEERRSWLASELAAVLELSDEALRVKAGFWVGSKVLVMEEARHGDVRYTLASEAGAQGAGEVDEDSWTGDESFVMTSDQVLEKEERLYESYVMTMLTNNESLVLEKIHNMLKMFMIEPKYNKTLVELETFLDKLLEQGKVLFEAGTYKKKGRRRVQ